MKANRVILTTLLAGIIFSLTATANAYVVFSTWPNSNNVYYVTTTALGSESITAFGNANTAWNNVANANKNIYRSGSTSATSVSRNGTNEVVKYYISSQGPLMATSVWQSNGYIAEFDIAINAAYNWRTDGASNAYDVQNCATHEIGHALWSAHVASQSDAPAYSDWRDITMHPDIFLGETKKRTLHQDDINGMSACY